MGRRGKDHNSLKYIFLIDSAKEIVHRFCIEKGKLLPFPPLDEPISFSHAKSTTQDERGVVRTATLALPNIDGIEGDLTSLEDSNRDIAGHLPPRLRYIKERTTSGPAGSGDDGSDMVLEVMRTSSLPAGGQIPASEISNEQTVTVNEQIDESETPPKIIQAKEDVIEAL